MVGQGDIFKVEHHLLTLDRDYIRGIPEFRVILERDRKSPGDADGRKKFRAYKEFMYIYIRASLFSYPNKGGYSDKDVHLAGIKEAELEENFKPDKEILAAIEKYKEIQLALLPTLNSISTILKTLKLTDQITQKIAKSIQTTIDMMEADIKKKEDAGEPLDAAANLLTVAGLVDQLDQVLKLGNKMPTTIETLEGLYERLKKEESSSSVLRGGREKGRRSDPTDKRSK